jgi:RimJ/RimL family protein N-acetyltransferase
METAYIRLRQTTEVDLDFVLQTERDPAHALYVGQWTREQHRQALTEANIRHIVVEDRASGLPVGYLILAGLCSPHHSIEFRRLVIVRKGEGYGKQALRRVIELAFTQWKAHRLWLDVRSGNDRAMQLYRSLGFKEEGVLRDAFYHQGEYGDLRVMSILEQEFTSRG